MNIGLCIETVFPDLELDARVAKAAAAGFRTFEIWDPENRDLGALRRAADAAGGRISNCTVAGCWGDGRLCGGTKSVVDSFRKTLPHLQCLGAKTAIILAGDEDPNMTHGEQREHIVRNLAALAPLAARAGVTLVLEALNSRVDHKGYYLHDTATGFEIIRAVDSPNVKLLYDVYHMQIMEGNVIATVTENIHHIGHFHAAGVPGRHELYHGELDYRRILEAIDRAGYQGSFGLEYWPTGDHAASLAETARYLGLAA